MKLNKILFFSCLCLLLLGMVDAVHAGSWSTNKSDENETLLTQTYGGTEANPYSLSLDPPTKWRKMWKKVEKHAPYYGMRATLPVYSTLTSRYLWGAGSAVLVGLLSGGVGEACFIGSVVGGYAGWKLAGSFKKRVGGYWMRAYLKSALKADIDKNVAITNALSTFKTFAKHQTLLKGIQTPKEFVAQEMKAVQEKQD